MLGDISMNLSNGEKTKERSEYTGVGPCVNKVQCELS